MTEMHPNEALIRKFYTAFQRLDSAEMKTCYDPDARFSDAVFPYLKREEVPAMWAMLLESLKKSGGNLDITFGEIIVNDVEGSSKLEARYIFSLTGKKVHNKITSKFQFRDGLIVEHNDYFDFYKWARMAFGFRGLLLGWTSFFKNKIQQGVAYRLKQWMEKNTVV